VRERYNAVRYARHAGVPSARHRSKCAPEHCREGDSSFSHCVCAFFLRQNGRREAELFSQLFLCLHRTRWDRATVVRERRAAVTKRRTLLRVMPAESVLAAIYRTFVLRHSVRNAVRRRSSRQEAERLQAGISYETQKNPAFQRRSRTCMVARRNVVPRGAQPIRTTTKPHRASMFRGVCAQR